jgi:hypothetical protein
MTSNLVAHVTVAIDKDGAGKVIHIRPLTTAGDTYVLKGEEVQLLLLSEESSEENRQLRLPFDNTQTLGQYDG